MSNFQVSIIDHSNSTQDKENKKFATRKHSRTGDKIANSIEELGGVWDQVIEKLTTLATKTQEASAISKFELNSIEFNVGVEAGISVGLVTKGDASVSVTFSRKSDTKNS